MVNTLSVAVHHRNHHDAMSIFVEKAGVNRRVFGATRRLIERYSLKYFLYFCYKNLQTDIFFVHPLAAVRGRAGGLAPAGSVKNIDY
ncbi:MAG TPA: hypothetical protein VL635_22490 [Trinickia sp.]|nr:hypothetical protein [Trinickia sp.]